MRRTWVLAAATVTVLGSAAVWYYHPPTKTEAAEQPKSGPKGDAAEKDRLIAKRDEPQQPTVGTQQLPIGQVVSVQQRRRLLPARGHRRGQRPRRSLLPGARTSTICSNRWSLRDLDGGHISTVSYDSNAPVERTLKSFAINLTGNPTFGAILNQARGEKVEVVLQQANASQPGTLSGTVVGIETAEDRRRQGHRRVRDAQPLVRRRHAIASR